MDKQEEIKKSVSDAVRLGICAHQHLGFGGKEIYDKIADEILKIQSRKGCVIKVEGELPTNKHRFPPVIYRDGVIEVPNLDFHAVGIYHDCQQDMLKAGYTLTEPLVEDDSVPPEGLQ